MKRTRGDSESEEETQGKRTRPRRDQVSGTVSPDSLKAVKDAPNEEVLSEDELLTRRKFENGARSKSDVGGGTSDRRHKGAAPESVNNSDEDDDSAGYGLNEDAVGYAAATDKLRDLRRRKRADQLRACREREIAESRSSRYLRRQGLVQAAPKNTKQIRWRSPLETDT